MLHRKRNPTYLHEFDSSLMGVSSFTSQVSHEWRDDTLYILFLLEFRHGYSPINNPVLN